LVLPQTSSLASTTRVATARYLPSRSGTSTEYPPAPFVVVVPTVFQVPETRRWIFTGTVEAHALVPSSTETVPLATRWRARDSVILRRCLTVKSSALVPVPAGPITVMGPVVAPFGTVATIWVPELKEKLALVPSNLTDVVPLRFAPVMTTVVPQGPIRGENDEMNGDVTVKFVELVSVPLGVVTEIGPVVAASGTVAVICVSESTLNVAETSLNFTAVAPVNALPVIVTLVPTGPLVGENDVICGGGAALTTKSVALVAVPAGVVTLIGPVCAPFGTVAVILVGESTVKAADLLLNFTSVAPVKPVPLIVTTVPASPNVGENDVIVGGAPAVTVKLSGLEESVPSGVVTTIGPVVAVEGTVVEILSDELTVKFAKTPLNVTEVAPSKFTPLIETDVPTGPLVGEKDVIDGSSFAVTMKSSALASVPSGVVTEIFPVEAPVGTLAVILVFEFTVNTDWSTPLNSTRVAPVRPVPLIVTVVPTGPLCGLKDVMFGVPACAGTA
jgi:hypothetical protein